MAVAANVTVWPQVPAKAANDRFEGQVITGSDRPNFAKNASCPETVFWWPPEAMFVLDDVTPATYTLPEPSTTAELP